jgi:hypothetical protein
VINGGNNLNLTNPIPIQGIFIFKIFPPFFCYNINFFMSLFFYCIFGCFTFLCVATRDTSPTIPIPSENHSKKTATNANNSKPIAANTTSAAFGISGSSKSNAVSKVATIRNSYENQLQQGKVSRKNSISIQTDPSMSSNNNMNNNNNIPFSYGASNGSGKTKHFSVICFFFYHLFIYLILID